VGLVLFLAIAGLRSTNLQPEWGASDRRAGMLRRHASEM
jgi:hypothetical protein